MACHHAFLQLPLFVLLRVEKLGVDEQQPPRPLEHRLLQDIGRLAVQFATELGGALCHLKNFDGMEVVEDNLRLGQVGHDRSQVHSRRVDGRCLDLG